MKNTAVKRISALLFVLTIFFTMFNSVNAAYNVSEIIVTEPNIPSEDNAYIIFEKNPREHKMSYVRGPNNKEDELYSENVVFGGIECRQVFVQNKFHMSFEDGFAKSSDRQFCFIMDYWDYSGGGSYRLEYTVDEQGTTKTVRIPKTGVEGTNNYQWHRVTAFVGDACFTGSMDNNADFRILSNAYNAFSKIEVINLSGKATTTDHIGVFNKEQAKTLDLLGLIVKEEEEDVTSDEFLSREITLKEAVCHTVRILGIESGNDEAIMSYAVKNNLLKGLSAADENGKITQRELLRIYFNILGINASPDEEQQAAEAAGIIKGENFVFQMNKNANFDNLAAVARNTLILKRQGAERTYLHTMFQNGVFSGEDLAACGDAEFVDSILKGSIKIMPEVRVDETSNRTYYVLSLFGQDAIKSYYTAQCWATDNKRFYFYDKNKSMYEYNIETNILTYIDDLLSSYCLCVSKKNGLFYINKQREFIRLDLDTYESKKIADPPVGSNPNIRNTIDYIQVMDNEEKLSIAWYETPPGWDYQTNRTKYAFFPILDIATGEWDVSKYYGFDTPVTVPNHICISPTNPKLLMFAHEGLRIKDRTWCYNLETGKAVNSFVQKNYIPATVYDTNIASGESFCHEAWVCDGERLFGVKTSTSWNLVNQTIGVCGLVIFNWDGTEKYYANGDYRYNHIGASVNNDRWFAGDTHFTSDKFNHLALIDAYTGQSYYLARLTTNGQNPGHAHPQFSHDGRYVTFGLWSENLKNVRIGWMDVSDITSNAPKSTRYDISKDCEAPSAEGLAHEIKPVVQNGANAYRIPKGNHMKVNVKKEALYEESADIKLTVEYLDDGAAPIRINYNTWHVLPVFNRLVEHNLHIERTNTGKWKTKTFNLENVSMDNMQWLGTDFNISGVNSEVIIKDILVEKNVKKGAKQ